MHAHKHTLNNYDDTNLHAASKWNYVVNNMTMLWYNKNMQLCYGMPKHNNGSRIYAAFKHENFIGNKLSIYAT